MKHFIEEPGYADAQPCRNCKSIENEPHPFIVAACFVCGAVWRTNPEPSPGDSCDSVDEDGVPFEF